MNIVKFNHLRVAVAVDRLLVMKQGFSRMDQCKAVAMILREQVDKKMGFMIETFMKSVDYRADHTVEDFELTFEFDFISHREDKLVEHCKLLAKSLRESDPDQGFDIGDWLERMENIISPPVVTAQELRIVE